MFIDSKTKYCQGFCFSQLDSKNPRKLFCGCQQPDFKVYMERQKIQVSQFNIKEKNKFRELTTLRFTVAYYEGTVI